MKIYWIPLLPTTSKSTLTANMKRFILGVLLVAATCIQTYAQQSSVEVLQLRPDFYMIAGAGGNVAVQIGSDGVVVVDSGTADKADEIIAAIKKLTNHPIRYIINTGPDADHVGGNEAVAKAGLTIFPLTDPNAARGALTVAMTNQGAASILAAENVLTRMSAPTGKASPFPTGAWPTETFNQKRIYMYMNGEGIEVLHQPAAHSDSDSMVFFRKSDIVVAGDVLDTTRFPVIDISKGGSIQGEIDALNRLLELAIPSIPFVWQQGGTYIIPGHGHIYDQTDILEYRDMVVIIRDRVQDLIKKGKTFEEIKAAEPAKGYARQYGADSGPWTTGMFIEAIYKSLTDKK
jgi:cyclase